MTSTCFWCLKRFSPRTTEDTCRACVAKGRTVSYTEPAQVLTGMMRTFTEPARRSTSVPFSSFAPVRTDWWEALERTPDPAWRGQVDRELARTHELGLKLCACGRLFAIEEPGLRCSRCVSAEDQRRSARLNESGCSADETSCGSCVDCTPEEEILPPLFSTHDLPVFDEEAARRLATLDVALMAGLRPEPTTIPPRWWMYPVMVVLLPFLVGVFSVERLTTATSRVIEKARADSVGWDEWCMVVGGPSWVVGVVTVMGFEHPSWWMYVALFVGISLVGLASVLSPSRGRR